MLLAVAWFGSRYIWCQLPDRGCLMKFPGQDSGQIFLEGEVMQQCAINRINIYKFQTQNFVERVSVELAWVPV